ncbi:hypothetical protein [Pseudomonas sp. MGal98]|uniref:hypothetical protein n=1 Tax=Pseudomonas sp. MGal98 TaxID=3162460 RepID=UPI0032EEB3D1
MSKQLPDAEPEVLESNDDVYSGGSVLLHSTKLEVDISIEEVCRILVSSNMFTLGLLGDSSLYYKAGGALKKDRLKIEQTIAGYGLTVDGLDGFRDADTSDSYAWSLNMALNLLLSEKKFFNSEFGFPAESARLFLRPICIRVEGVEEYEILIPILKYSSGGIISLSLYDLLGFTDSSLTDVVRREVNKSQLNVVSVLCEKDFHLACAECQISEMPLKERLSKRNAIKRMIASALSESEVVPFADEQLELYELLHGISQMTLTDVARNLLSVVARAVDQGRVITDVNWYGRQSSNRSIGKYWHSKPIVNIHTHTSQADSSIVNAKVHQRLIDSVLTRIPLRDGDSYSVHSPKDMRGYDDFNNFYSESVSLLLASAKVVPALEKIGGYDFENMISDMYVLNEAALYISIYYSYASIALSSCDNAVDVIEVELDVLRFEESLAAIYKFGEVVNYFGEVRRGSHFDSVYKGYQKKIEVVRKAIELSESKAENSYNRHLTIIFGIIASATLSPELIMPLARIYRVSSGDDSVDKVLAIILSMLLVFAVVMLIGLFFRVANYSRRRMFLARR